MITLDYESAHEFVDGRKHAFWDGWDLVIWRKNPEGATNRFGLFRNGAWGIAKRVAVGDDGIWRVPNKYVRT